MPAYDYDAFLDEATQIIAETWPDVITNGVLEDDESQRESWERRTPPWAVFELGDAEPSDEYGGLTADAYEWEFTVHRVVTEEEGRPALRADIDALRDAMNETYFSVSQATLIPGRTRLSFGTGNTLNQYFLNRNAPFMGASITFRFTGGTGWR